MNLADETVNAYKTINNSQLYQNRDDLLPGPYPEPVIFEPIRSIRLSRSVYKVISFIDFGKYLDSFIFYEKYLAQFQADLKNTKKMDYLNMAVKANARREDDPGFDEDWNYDVIDDKECNAQCRMKEAYRKILVETEYLIETYRQIKNRFLTAIDHIDKDKSLQSKQEKTQTPKNRRKRDVLGFFLGWGVYSNYRNIKKLKKNIHILQQQNLLQDAQIHELADYLNLTATHVRRNQQKLYELDLQLLEVHRDIELLTETIKNQIYFLIVLQDLRTCITRLTTGLISLRENVERIYEYLRVMATHAVNPLILPPESLRNVLTIAKETMATNPRLVLPHDPNNEIWEYYQIMKVTPLVYENWLTIVLEIPLIDQSLQMDIYKAHNLPTIHPDLGVEFMYELEGQYLAISKHKLYVAIPNKMEIDICLATEGGLCRMNTALYPIEQTKWCLLALFTKDREQIFESCKVKTNIGWSQYAVSLGGYLWAVSSLVGQNLQVRCLTETTIEQIKPPIHVLKIGNGCEGYSNTVSIPAKSEITTQFHDNDRSDFFLAFNAQYQNITAYGNWLKIPKAKLTEEEKQKIKDKFQILPPMTYKYLNKELELIDEDYPSSAVIYFILAALIGLTISYVITIICLVVKLKKAGVFTAATETFNRVIKGQFTKNDFNALAQRVQPLFTPGIVQTIDELITQQQRPPLPPRPTTLQGTDQQEDSAGETIYEILSDLSEQGVPVTKYRKYLKQRFSKRRRSE